MTIEVAVEPLVNWHEQAIPDLLVDGFAQMPFTGDILDQDHLPSIDDPGFTVARRDLHTIVKIDDVLPPGRVVPIEIVRRLYLAKNDSSCGKALRIATTGRGLNIFNVDVFKMRFAIVIRVQMMDFHTLYPVSRVRH